MMKSEIRNPKSERNPKAAARIGCETALSSGFGFRISGFGFSHHAFTLLELLLAVLVFSIVLGAIHVVFFTAFKLRNKTADAIERSLPVQQTLAILKRDLANLVPPGGTLSGALQDRKSVV